MNLGGFACSFGGVIDLQVGGSGNIDAGVAKIRDLTVPRRAVPLCTTSKRSGDADHDHAWGAS